jgi:hypothetical protein
MVKVQLLQAKVKGTSYTLNHDIKANAALDN